MKKTFEQPELMVVRVKQNDIITESINKFGEADNNTRGDAADRMGRESWDAGY